MHQCIDSTQFDWVKVGQMFEAAKMTNVAVAAACNTSQPQISRLFSGKTENPLFPLGRAVEILFNQTFPGQPIPELLMLQTNDAQSLRSPAADSSISVQVIAAPEAANESALDAPGRA
jgi:hypothetical protein